MSRIRYRKWQLIIGQSYFRSHLIGLPVLITVYLLKNVSIFEDNFYLQVLVPLKLNINWKLSENNFSQKKIARIFFGRVTTKNSPEHKRTSDRKLRNGAHFPVWDPFRARFHDLSVSALKEFKSKMYRDNSCAHDFILIGPKKGQPCVGE